MDGVSAAASVLALIEAVGTVGTYLQDVKNYDKEHKDFVKQLDGFDWSLRPINSEDGKSVANELVLPIGLRKEMEAASK